MSRRNIATITCLAAAFGLMLAAGCKKKKTDSGSKGDAPVKVMKAPPVSDMDPMGMQAGMNATRPAPTPGKGRVGALPIPYDYLIVTAYLKAMRNTALYKKHEPKLKAMIASALASRKAIADMVSKCKVDILGGVDGVTIGHTTENRDPEATVIIARGGFDTDKLMACMKPEMKKAKIEFKDVTVGGKNGFEVTVDGKMATVLALGPKSLAMFGKPVLAKAQEVLEGKLQSIEDTPIFKELAKLVEAKPATILSALVPKIPAFVTGEVKFPIAKKVRTMVAMVGVPDGGLDLYLGADFGDDKTAKTIARTLPALLGFAKAKLGAIGAKLLQSLKVNADGTWVRVALQADKATFKKLQDMAMKMLSKVMSMGGAVKQPVPTAKPDPAKPAPKKGK